MLNETPKLEFLYSTRLRLEPLVLAHADRLFTAHQDPELYHWMEHNPPTDPEAYRERIRFLEQRISRDKTEYWFQWIAFDRTDTANDAIPIARVEISLNPATRRALLGYFVYRPHWRKGFAVEACSTVIEHVKSQWGASSVTIEMDTRNERSVKLAERLGAKFVWKKENAEFWKDNWVHEFRYDLTL